MSRGPDVDTMLLRALVTHAEVAGCPLSIVTSEWTRWASATFTGARHLLSLKVAASPAFDRWIAALSEAEFALRGHLVADLTVESLRREGDSVTAMIEVLTVEDR